MRMDIKYTMFVMLLFHFKPTQSRGKGDEFGYEKGSSSGPDKWGRLRKDWTACSTGHLQSPISLVDKGVVLRNLGDLDTRYNASEAIVVNRGHDIMLIWEGEAGGLWLNGTEYALHQMHWHVPSEHTINGRRYAAEMHMVHASADRKIAVVGFLYAFDRPDPFLSKLEPFIRLVKDVENGNVSAGVVDPGNASEGRKAAYYRYSGSLTTPPCTQGVAWTVLRKVRPVSRKQVRLLKDAVILGYKKNARPIQPTNKRIIRFYRPRLA